MSIIRPVVGHPRRRAPVVRGVSRGLVFVVFVAMINEVSYRAERVALDQRHDAQGVEYSMFPRQDCNGFMEALFACWYKIRVFFAMLYCKSYLVVIRSRLREL